MVSDVGWECDWKAAQAERAGTKAGVVIANAEDDAVRAARNFLSDQRVIGSTQRAAADQRCARFEYDEMQLAHTAMTARTANTMAPI